MSFRSLLQGFQAATGTPVTNNSNAVGSSDNGAKPKDKKAALLEWTSQVWNQTLIRRATSRRRFRDENQPKAQIATSSSSSDSPISQKTEKLTPRIHLAVCICIVDALPHENIWRRWIQDSTSTVTASVYLHAKDPDKIRETGSTWLQECLIPISHHPNWNDVRIVRAMLSLIEHALEQPTRKQRPQDDSNDASDNPITHILFATESCIPIAPIQTLEQVLLQEPTGKQRQQSSTQTNCSFLDYYGKDQATRFEERQCWHIVSQFLPMDCIQKALPGWCLLTAQHALEVLHLSYPHRPKSPLLADLMLPPLPLPEMDLTTAFEECWAPEEVYFPTALCLLGHIVDEDHEGGPRPTVQRVSVVHAEWPPCRRESERAHPKNWDDDFSTDLVTRLRQGGSPNNGHDRDQRRHESHSDGTHELSTSSSHVLFLRKVKYQMPIERWEQAVLVATNTHHHLSVNRTLSTSRPRTAHSSSAGHQSSYRAPRYDSSQHGNNYSQQQQQRPRSYSPSNSSNKRRRPPDERHYRQYDREDKSWHQPSQRQRRYDDSR